MSLYKNTYTHYIYIYYIRTYLYIYHHLARSIGGPVCRPRDLRQNHGCWVPIAQAPEPISASVGTWGPYK